MESSMNKRGVFFGLYLLILTIFMIALVIILYFQQQKDVNASLVSPVQVLNERDRLEIFGMREDEIAIEVFRNVGADAVEFKKSFLDKVENDEWMKKFLLDESLIVDSKEVDLSNLDFRNFLENRVYKNGFESKNKEIIVTRSVLTKKIRLTPVDNDKEIRFPVNFYFDFGRTFKVDEKGVVDR